MKLFLDTAQIQDIKKWVTSGLVDGVTTNPTHLSKVGLGPLEVIKQICDALPDGDISVEVTEKTPDAVYLQAKKIAELSENIVVKIPCHKKYFEIIKKLVKEDVKLNITLVFSALQGFMVAKLGVAYVSPFIGRLEDVGEDGIQLVHDLRLIFDQYNFSTEILAASIRSIDHFHYALLAGADVITMKSEILEKACYHMLTESGMKKFDEDWKKLGIRQFP